MKKQQQIYELQSAIEQLSQRVDYLERMVRHYIDLHEGKHPDAPKVQIVYVPMPGTTGTLTAGTKFKPVSETYTVSGWLRDFGMNEPIK